jgi:drug/metabolite transporter (DMT)-like permease
MARRHLLMLLALAAIWGSSFMFIKVAARELSPSAVVTGRVLLGTLGLLPAVPFVLGWSRTWIELRRHAGALLLMGILNAAVPFWFLTWSEQHIDSGLAAVLQASTPLFTALLALGFSSRDRIGGWKLVGVVVGFVGVALLVGAQPQGDVFAALAVLLTALCYSISALYGGRRLQGVHPFVISLGSLTAASIVSLPFGLAQPPSEVPSWRAIASVVALGIVGLSIAYILYFALILDAGASYAVLVTYLVPALALGYGAIFLDESITASAIAGLLLILAGVALGTGALRLRRRRRAALGQAP